MPQCLAAQPSEVPQCLIAQPSEIPVFNRTTYWDSSVFNRTNYWDPSVFNRQTYWESSIFIRTSYGDHSISICTSYLQRSPSYIRSIRDKLTMRIWQCIRLLTFSCNNLATYRSVISSKLSLHGKSCLGLPLATHVLTHITDLTGIWRLTIFIFRSQHQVKMSDQLHASVALLSWKRWAQGHWRHRTSAAGNTSKLIITSKNSPVVFKT